MTRRLTFYLLRQILLTFLVLMLALSALYIVINFIEESSSIGQGYYSYKEAFVYIIFTLPSLLQVGMPVLGLMSGLIALGHLAKLNELTIMRCAGISIKQIIMMVSVAAWCLMAFTYFLNTYASPKLEHLGDIIKASALQNQAIWVGAKAIWVKDGSDFIYIQRAQLDGRLQGVIRYHVKDYQLASISSAQSARYQNKNWVLHGLTTVYLQPNQVSKTFTKQAIWPSLVKPNILKVLLANPDTLALPSLVSYISYLHQNHQNVGPYWLKLWKIIFGPLSVWVMMILAVPFVFGNMRGNHFGMRLLIGGFVGFAFFITDEFSSSITLLYGIPSLIGVLLPPLIFTIGLLLMLRRIDR